MHVLTIDKVRSLLEADSLHYMTDRAQREQKIKEIGVGKVLDSFYQDRGHRNGPEIHVVTSTGIIIIYNARTRVMVTKKIARPKQIEDLYISKYNSTSKIPQDVLNIARYHQRMGWNEL